MLPFDKKVFYFHLFGCLLEPKNVPLKEGTVNRFKEPNLKGFMVGMGPKDLLNQKAQNQQLFYHFYIGLKKF